MIPYLALFWVQTWSVIFTVLHRPFNSQAISIFLTLNSAAVTILVLCMHLSMILLKRRAMSLSSLSLYSLCVIAFLFCFFYDTVKC